jgi:hypothetical protein
MFTWTATNFSSILEFAVVSSPLLSIGLLLASALPFDLLNQACGRENDCLEMYKFLEATHPVPKLRRQVGVSSGRRLRADDVQLVPTIVPTI